jgi:hypothetical protein
MRVVVWNMRKATNASPAWNYFLELAPDLALLQEIGSNPQTVCQTYQRVARRAAGKTGGVQKFSTAILARGEVGPSILLSSEWTWVNEELGRFAGNLVAESVALANGSCVQAPSAYSPAWPVAQERLVGADVSQVKLVHSPDVWVTELLWAALRNRSINAGPPWLVGGDLNCSETFDDMWPNGPLRQPRSPRSDADSGADGVSAARKWWCSSADVSQLSRAEGHPSDGPSLRVGVSVRALDQL